MKQRITAGLTAFITAYAAVMNLSVCSAVAETETTSATTSTVKTSLSSAVTTQKSAETTTAVKEKKKEITVNETDDWYKAELDDYEGRLSLVSYETAPEMPGNNPVAAGARTPGVPTPVPLRTSGGEIKSVPFTNSEPVINADPGQFAIVTYGWGHGVGLSQNGANYYAEYSGWTYQDILFHYYPDTYLMNTGEAEDEKITIDGEEGDVLEQVAAIVNCEVGGWMNYEAIKAQAVAVYTYCKYNNNDAADLRGKPNPPQIVIDACSEVLGEALYYNDDFALTMFSASSGGITANCYEVFWADLPYLRSVSSDYDAALDPHYGTVTYFTDTYIKNMIERKYEIKLSPDPGNWIKPIYSDTTGYVTEVNIDDKITVRGYDFKLDMGLKSSKFKVYYTYKSSSGEYEDDNDYTDGRYNIEEDEIDMSENDKTTEPTTQNEEILMNSGDGQVYNPPADNYYQDSVYSEQQYVYDNSYYDNSYYDNTYYDNNYYDNSYGYDQNYYGY